MKYIILNKVAMFGLSITDDMFSHIYFILDEILASSDKYELICKEIIRRHKDSHYYQVSFYKIGLYDSIYEVSRKHGIKFKYHPEYMRFNCFTKEEIVNSITIGNKSAS